MVIFFSVMCIVNAHCHLSLQKVPHDQINIEHGTHVSLAVHFVLCVGNSFKRLEYVMVSEQIVTLLAITPDWQ